MSEIRLKKALASRLAALLCAAVVAAAQEDPIAWSLERTAPASPNAKDPKTKDPKAKDPSPGQKKASDGAFAIAIAAKIAPGWHLYSISQPPGGPIATRIWLPDGQPFKQSGDLQGPQPLTAFEPSFNMDVEFYEGSAQFRVNVAPKPAAKQTLRVNAYYQICNDKLCLPPKTVKLELAVDTQ